MVRILFSTVMLSVLALPVSPLVVRAQVTEREYLTAQIAALFEQIAQLQLLLQTARTSELQPVRDDRSQTSAKVRTTRARSDYEDFVESLYGQTLMRRYVEEVVVYRDTDAAYDARVSRAGRAARWTLELNRAAFDLSRQADRRLLADLLIHELAHMLAPDVSGLLSDYEARFWTDADRRHATRAAALRGNAQFALTSQYYFTNSSRFVSDYGTLSPEEDLAETFVSYVRDESLPGGSVVAKKRDFLGQYQTFRDAKRVLRNNSEDR